MLNTTCLSTHNAVEALHASEEELDETLGDSVEDSTDIHSDNQNECPINQRSSTSDEEQDTDIGPAASLCVEKAKSSLQCPYLDCVGNTSYSKKTHLLQHYKMRRAIYLTVHYTFSKGKANKSLYQDVTCDVQCRCDDTFDRVDKFEKHLRNCPIMQNENKGGAIRNEDCEASHIRTLGLKKHLSSVARKELTRALAKVGAESGQKTSMENFVSDGQSNSTENIEHHCQTPKRAYSVCKFILILS